MLEKKYLAHAAEKRKLYLGQQEKLNLVKTQIASVDRKVQRIQNNIDNFLLPQILSNEQFIREPQLKLSQILVG